MAKPATIRATNQPRKRRLTSATIPPRKHRAAKSKPTSDTIPPFFPSLELPEEILTEPAPVFLVSDGQQIEIPAILLEAEHPHAPASAGDGRLHVTARDPHWLYVHWDLTRDQQAKLNTESNHGHLIVRLYLNSLNSKPAGENHVHPQSRHWFAHVETPGATYYAELGLYVGKEWRRVAAAGPVTPSRQRFAFDTSASYITIHPDLPLADQLEPKCAAEPNWPEQRAFAAADSTNYANDWSPEQQLAVLRALGVVRVNETVSGDSGAGESTGALESTAGLSSEADATSSAGGGFGEAASSLEFAREFSMSASSMDAPLFSLAESSSPSS